MNCNDDIRVIQRNPEIAGLTKLLDNEALLDVLRARLPAVDLQRASVNCIRFKQGMNCLATIELVVGKQIVRGYAKAHGFDSQVKLAKSRKKPATDGALGPGRITIDEHGIVISTYPNDMKLRYLHRLSDQGGCRRLITKLIGDHPALSSGRLENLAYKPERRCVNKLLTEDGPKAVVRIQTPGAHRYAYRIARKLRASNHLLLPRLIGRSQSRCALAFDWIPGISVRELTADQPPDMEAVVQASAALAMFHRQEPLNLHIRTRQSEANTVLSKARDLHCIVPALGEHAMQLASQLSSWLLGQPQYTTVIHGDFYDKQAIVNHRGVYLIDLDNVELGDPCADIGLYIAHLEFDAIMNRIPASQPERLRVVFLEGYTEASTLPAPDRIAMYIAIGIFQLIHHPFRSREKDWAVKINCLLQKAGEFINSAEQRLPTLRIIK